MCNVDRAGNVVKRCDWSLEFIEDITLAHSKGKSLGDLEGLLAFHEKESWAMTIKNEVTK